MEFEARGKVSESGCQNGVVQFVHERVDLAHPADPAIPSFVLLSVVSSW